MDSLGRNDPFLAGSFRIIPATGSEVGDLCVQANEEVVHCRPLVGRNRRTEVAKRSHQLPAKVGEDLELLIEGERLSCLGIAGERTINVELSVGEKAIDYPVDLSMSELGGALDQFSPLLFVSQARNLYGVLLR
jgi:hypothetical protein